MRLPQGAEWLIILVLILLLFGAKRLPDAARGLGRSLRILKAETKGLGDDDAADSDQAAPVASASAPAPLPPSQSVPQQPEQAAPPAGQAPASDPAKPQS